MDSFLIIILIMGIILVEAFFSSSEIAMISLNRFMLNDKVKSGSEKAKMIMKLLEHPTELISTTLLGTNLSVVTSSTLATFLVINVTHDVSKAYIAPLIMSPIILIFGELIPKSIGQKFADTYAGVIYPLTFAKFMFYPLAKVFSLYTRFVYKQMGMNNSSKAFVPSREQLKVLLQNADSSSDLKEHEKEMADNVLSLSDISAEECMSSLAKIDALPINAKIQDAIELIEQKGHSRIPLYDDRIDNIVKMLHSFDLLDAKNSNDEIANYAVEPMYIAASTPVDKLLKVFKNKGVHMAVVVDEFGAAVGVITIEDIIEEIIGEIHDEFDDEITMYVRISEKMYLVNASIELDMINEALGMDLKTGDYTTLGGYLLDLFEKIPKQGDRIQDDNNEYIISKASKRMIEEVIIKIKDTNNGGNNA